MATPSQKYDPLRDLDGDGDIDAGDNRINDLNHDGRIDAEDRENRDLDNDNDIDASDRELERQKTQEQEQQPAEAKQSVRASLALTKGNGTSQKSHSESVPGPKVR